MIKWSTAGLLLAGSLWAGDVARVDPSITVTDVRGKTQHPFQTGGKSAAIVFFVTTDCPISNGYAHEIHELCDGYASRATCALDYVDPTLKADEVTKHFTEYGHGDYPAIVDVKHVLVKAAGATVTPEAVVVLPDGTIAYRGRIDDKNVALGVARRQALRADLRLALEAVLAGKPVEVPRTKAVGCSITPLEFFRKGQ